LNIDKDHQEIDELNSLFNTFKTHTKGLFVTNQTNALAAALSVNINNDFSTDEHPAQYQATQFQQQGFEIRFQLKQVNFLLHTVGKHNMENAVAAIAVAHQLGIELSIAAEALSSYEGIYRRHQVLGNKRGVWVIDDYAHNPAKCAASIRACQAVAPKVVAWFQPHGYGPTRFLKNDFISEIAAALRPEDEIWMSEIFYAGGTAVKDISANDLIVEIRNKGKQAFFVENRNDFLKQVQSHLSNNCVLLLMGARDPGLEQFGKEIWEKL
jgi:UDP-N-acetylmuramate--alanine ligase